MIASILMMISMQTVDLQVDGYYVSHCDHIEMYLFDHTTVNCVSEDLFKDGFEDRVHHEHHD